MNCRFCGNPLFTEFVDLHHAPASNSYLTFDQLNKSEIYYPQKLFVCDQCLLVQIDEYKNSNEIFSEDYSYFSSFSNTWLMHAEAYVKTISSRLCLSDSSSVLEIASNDGYLLQYFLKTNIPCIGIEPSVKTADVAEKKGIKTINEFFTEKLARSILEEYGPQNLIIGNNVYAHVPDIKDFTIGLKVLLNKEGTITLEFPHLLNLIALNQFDTIYHEHYSYLSLLTVEKIFESSGLRVYDVEELSTHGGSLRVYGCHRDNNNLVEKNTVSELREKEFSFGLSKLSSYKGFINKVRKVRMELNKFLQKSLLENKKVVAYGAAAKGNTLMNYCGIRGTELINYIVDRSPHKQNKYMPGSHIPIVKESKLRESKPDYILILPWNLEKEISNQLEYVRAWQGKFVVAIPSLRIF